MSRYSIKVENLGKKFTPSLKRSMAYGTIDILRSMAGIPYKTNHLRKGEVWVLDDVNFELKPGESLGLIGRNGSGKTTLLRILSGIFPPDKGKVVINGKIGALIAVGAGFHPHMTGRENIYLNGAILGMSRHEIQQKLEAIIDFAELGAYIDAPVSTYSSGMSVRLGFAIAVHSVPEILLVDEILAVGDMKFQQKCFARVGELVKQGTSIILVSHQMANIQKICAQSILLDQGKVISYGDSVEVIQDYFKLNTELSELEAETTDKQLVSSYNITYDYVKFYNERGQETRKFPSGSDITIKMKYKLERPVKNVTFQFSLSDGPYTYNSYNTYYDGIEVPMVDNNTEICLTIKNVQLSPGKYSASVGIWDEKFIGAYYWDYETPGFIEITPTKKMQSRFEFPHHWSIKSKLK